MSTQNSIDIIKRFCKLISSYDVQHIQCDYDGSGDSGDMTCYVTKPRNSEPGAVPSWAVNETTHEMTSVLDSIIKEKDSIITQKHLDDFYDAVYDLLPGGWEINDGSYGSVSITVGTGAVRTTHNERITDIETTERDY